MSQILLWMIGSTVRYFILRCVSLWCAHCVLNSVADVLRETLRTWWLHPENMIASTPLIFMFFEAIFIFVFVCSWWKKMKRPADLMNFAARITTASQTTGGVTARTTVETTQTSRAAVSTWLSDFLSAQFVHSYTQLTFYTHLERRRIGLWRLQTAPPTTTAIYYTLTHKLKLVCAPHW